MSTKYLYERRIELHKIAPDVFPLESEEQWITEAVDELIKYLYQPDKEHEWGWVANHHLLVDLGFADEPINYGDLKCVEVERLGTDGFLVVIDEADPSCARFCAWIAEWLQIFGWKCRVETEW